MIVKAISVQEPHASLIRSSQKLIETRTWNTDYRGPLLIHCSKKPKSQFSGMAIAITNLVDCRPMLKCHETQACCKIYPGAYSWFLKDTVPIKPVPIKGRLRLFDVEVKCDS
jgi:hypothetical protein